MVIVFHVSKVVKIQVGESKTTAENLNQFLIFNITDQRGFFLIVHQKVINGNYDAVISAIFLTLQSAQTNSSTAHHHPPLPAATSPILLLMKCICQPPLWVNQHLKLLCWLSSPHSSPSRNQQLRRKEEDSMKNLTGGKEQKMFPAC